ncbi:periodic tryptophan protein 1 homolog [Ricinus communis]|uniref:WD-repeat protein, putative n=1 Tax=Ricinus communis TaxID=3988 RepID=B9S699_RICCO|nr:periodic tryptophan protein 1 homolog [Ricinus communis]EEF40789.1 WD-repeat protein, putative [Ricinus communis]|eukprot:XP_002521518.1 periodic tryptophan protein 1 homolog [Ricinus communis]
MIAAVSWVPKGVSKSVPAVAEPPSKEEIEEMINSGALDRGEDSGSEKDDENMEIDNSKQNNEVDQALAVADALGRAPKSTIKFDDITEGLKELDMDNYDEEDEGIELFSTGLGDLYYPSNEADPYLNDNDDEDSEDLEDMTINPKDAVIVCARNEDEFSHLEVWIIEESDDGDSNMYVHHDIILSAFPLCTAWLDCPLKGAEKGNFIAVGSMEPSIEIWDLDIVDEVQPSVVLGGVAEKKKKKKGKKTSIKYKEGSHTDSVLGLAWNKQFRNILASASADKQVKIWDVATGKCDITMEHHTDKVQAVAWNYHEPQVLLSGSFDHSVVLKDGRIPTHPGFKWYVTADVESLAWDPHNTHSFVVSLEDGTVQGFDIRTAKTDSTSDSKPSFTLHAHDKAVCTVSYNPSVPNLLATGSTDKMVKLWDLSNNQPSCVASKDPKAGGIFSISFSEDSPFSLAIGGSKGKLQVWDISSDAGVSRRFMNSSKQNGPHPGT